jgi:hypothetical protein
MQCIYNQELPFEWDPGNLRKIRVPRIKREEALLNHPIPIHEQEVDAEIRFIYYGETDAGRLIALVAGQKQDYLERRVQGE